MEAEISSIRAPGHCSRKLNCAKACGSAAVCTHAALFGPWSLRTQDVCERSLRNRVLEGGDMRNCMEEKVKEKMLRGV